jgi:hypothetical protein
LLKGYGRFPTGRIFEAPKGRMVVANINFFSFWGICHDFDLATPMDVSHHVGKLEQANLFFTTKVENFAKTVAILRGNQQSPYNIINVIEVS